MSFGYRNRLRFRSVGSVRSSISVAEMWKLGIRSGRSLACCELFSFFSFLCSVFFGSDVYVYVCMDCICIYIGNEFVGITLWTGLFIIHFVWMILQLLVVLSNAVVFEFTKSS